MMKKVLVAFTLLFICSLSVWAQNWYIPFRDGDKFGLVDNNLKTKLAPAFDILNPIDETGLNFTAYQLKNGGYTSSLILNGQMVLKEQHYKYYNIEETFIIGSSYTLVGTNYYGASEVTERSGLFYKNGKRVFKSDFSDVSIIKHQGIKNMNDVAVCIKDTLNRYSLLVFDRKTLKQTQTIYKDVELLDTDWEPMYESRHLEQLYKDKQGKVYKLVLSFREKNVKVVSNEEIELPKSNDHDGFGFEGHNEPHGIDAVPNTSSPKSENTTHISYVSSKIYDSPALPKLYAISKENNTSLLDIFRENDKQGLMHSRKDSVVLPAVYDKITMLGDYIGFALKQGDKYGVYYKDIIIEPIFANLAVPHFQHYGQQYNILFQVFDHNFNFLYYANSNGTLFYKK